jgi:hypothetical protein
MKKNRLKPKYYTNKSVRSKIDRMLEKNARNVASSGTGSKHDIGDKGVDLAWEQFQKEIKEIDPEFYDMIK